MIAAEGAHAAETLAEIRHEFTRRSDRAGSQWFESDPNWFQSAVFYEVHVRGFADGNDDGIGDFLGLTDKLDYLQVAGRGLHLAAADVPVAVA